MSDTEIDTHDVLHEYGQVLASPHWVIRDANDLPYSKDVIKFVLQHCIKAASDEQTLDYLKTAYTSLAHFQKMSEDELKAVEVMSNMGNAEDLSSDELKDLASRISEAGYAHEAMLERCQVELNDLKQELAQFTR